MDLWFTEEDDQSLRYGYKIKKTLFEGQSEFQSVVVLDTEAYGKMLVIDGFVMITDTDEFVYHEMISHIPTCLHKDPKKVVVIGGGDGGTVRELLKHPSIEEIVLCEIDSMVVEQSRKWFPQVACGLDDPRVSLRIGDGIAYMAEQEDSVDIAIIDSTDPIGPGEGLFSTAFYKSVSRALKPGGLMVAQSESPWYDPPILQRIYKNISGGFPHIRPYLGSVPTYPRGLWTWTLASMSPIDPASFDKMRFSSISSGLNYLTEDGFTGAFALPPFYRRKLEIS
jgi:spermidine synthase